MTPCTQLIGIHLSKLSFCQVAVVTSLDSVGVVVAKHLALLARIKAKLFPLLLTCSSARALVRLASSPSFNSYYDVEVTDDFAAFELSERICSVVRGLRGEHFNSTAWSLLRPTLTTITNSYWITHVYRFLGQIIHGGKKNSADYLLVCGVFAIFVMI